MFAKKPISPSRRSSWRLAIGEPTTMSFDRKLEGSSGFAEKFSARGPHDSKGRTLRQFDLARRIFRYPCSYMIYSEAFDALPPMARDLVYERMWRILSGQESNKDYARLLLADRQAIVEI